MRGRTSVLGARISSIVLLIVTMVEVHRPDLRLDVFSLFSRDAIFRVNIFICPSAVPWLHWHPSVCRVQCVLGDLSLRNKEAKKPRHVIRLKTLCSATRFNVKE